MFIKEWPRHPVFYSAHHNKWISEHADTLIPRDARLFYNEEDWNKFKNMARTVKLPNLGISDVREINYRAFADTKRVGKKGKKPQEDMKFYFWSQPLAYYCNNTLFYEFHRTDTSTVKTQCLGCSIDFLSIIIPFILIVYLHPSSR